MFVLSCRGLSLTQMFRDSADFGFDILGMRHHTNYIYFRHESCTHTLQVYFMLYFFFNCASVSTAMCHMRPGVEFPSVLVLQGFWILEDSQLSLYCLLPFLNVRFLKNQVSLLGEALLWLLWPFPQLSVTSGPHTLWDTHRCTVIFCLWFSLEWPNWGSRDPRFVLSVMF